MNAIMNDEDAVEIIKTAILQSQYDAACSVNEKQLMLYYGIGKYISLNSRKGFWGKGAMDAISGRLDRELPGLKGFSARNLRNMRTFYEEWAALDHERDEELNLANASAKTGPSGALQIWQTLPVSEQTKARFFDILPADRKTVDLVPAAKVRTGARRRNCFLNRRGLRGSGVASHQNVRCDIRENT